MPMLTVHKTLMFPMPDIGLPMHMAQATEEVSQITK